MGSGNQHDMPRRAVIAAIAREHGVSKIEADHILRTALGEIASQLAQRKRFHIAEIGSLSVARRPPRPYFNPRTRSDAMSSGDVALRANISKRMRKTIEDNSDSV